MKDAAFFQTPILFMEPVPGGSKLSPEHKKRVFNSHSNPIWNTARPGGLSKYTDAEVQRLREYVINRGGFLYIATHGNTDNAMNGTRKVLRDLLPEHHLGFVPNDHPIYNSYYSLNGPLRFPCARLGLSHTPFRFILVLLRATRYHYRWTACCLSRYRADDARDRWQGSETVLRQVPKSESSPRRICTPRGATLNQHCRLRHHTWEYFGL